MREAGLRLRCQPARSMAVHAVGGSEVVGRSVAQIALVLLSNLGCIRFMTPAHRCAVAAGEDRHCYTRVLVGGSAWGCEASAGVVCAVDLRPRHAHPTGSRWVRRALR
jgi:hypothetical protein